MAYTPRDTDISAAFEEDEDNSTFKTKGDITITLKVELLSVVRAMFQRAVGVTRRVVLRKAAVNILRDTFSDAYKGEEKRGAGFCLPTYEVQSDEFESNKYAELHPGTNIGQVVAFLCVYGHNRLSFSW